VQPCRHTGDDAGDLGLLRHSRIGCSIDPTAGGQPPRGSAKAPLVCHEAAWPRGESLARLGEDPVTADDPTFDLSYARGFETPAGPRARSAPPPPWRGAAAGSARARPHRGGPWRSDGAS
jgi:hypothetical protein